MAGRNIVLCSALLLAACGGEAEPLPGEVPVFDGIGEGETVDLLGTEPFWSAKIEGSRLTWSTPEDIDGTSTPVSRFAGNNGLGFSGTLDGSPLQVAVTPGDCSDAMSDRSYPFTATVSIGETIFEGCAYSSNNPFTGEENP